jgi:hypothetical protein
LREKEAPAPSSTRVSGDVTGEDMPDEPPREPPRPEPIAEPLVAPASEPPNSEKPLQPGVVTPGEPHSERGDVASASAAADAAKSSLGCKLEEPLEPAGLGGCSPLAAAIPSAPPALDVVGR